MTARKYLKFKDLTAEEFKAMCRYVKSMTGIDIEENEKSYSLLNSRLGKIVYQRDLENFSGLLRELKVRNPNIIEEFISSVTTHTTHFFREKQHFKYLESELKKKAKYGKYTAEELMIWCAAASSGEEAYTIAIICENIKTLYPDFNYKILATDVDSIVLKSAQRGIYPYDKVKQIPLDYINPKIISTLKKDDKKYFKIEKEIKNKITFAKLNLVNHGYNIHKKFDYIFCRNVFIYFKKDEVFKIIEKIIPYLKNKGVLFLGHSEANLGKLHDLEAIIPAVFMKKGV